VGLGFDDAHPESLAGATVDVLQEGALIGSTTTDRSGAYSFFLASGVYRLQVAAIWHGPATVDGVVVLGETTTVQDFALLRTGWDDCAEATQLWEGYPRSGSTAAATGSDVTSCATNDTQDVWFRYTPASDGFAIFDLCGSTFDTTLAVFDACDGAELACNDDFCNEQSQVTVPVFVGSTYFVRVAGYNGATGDYTLFAGLSTYAGRLQGTVMGLGFDDMHPESLAGASVEVLLGGALITSVPAEGSGFYRFVLGAGRL
jgi:hypothetical protein